MDTIQRICLNAHHDVTNVVNNEDLQKVVIPTLDLFIKQLERICGPFARNALIIKADETLGTAMGSEMDMRMFLRDGRHIIRSTDFVSPIQQYLKSIVLYIGSRVDAICKDGTTTSMLFTCHLIKQLVANQQEFSLSTLLEIEQTFDRVIRLLTEDIFHQKIDVDLLMNTFNCNENEAAGAIAFLQAYTASGCNLEIATAISQFFRRMPKAIWGDRIDHTISRVEKSGYVCKADTCDAEYEMTTIMLTTQYRNTDMRRIIQYESADVLIMPQGIHDASLSTDELVEYLKKRLEKDENKTPLLICSPGGDHCSPKIVAFINERAKTYGVDIPVVAYNVKTKGTTPWIALTVCGKANVPLYQEITPLEDSVIKNVSVRIDATTTQFNNLSPKDERLDEESLIHPGMIYPDDYPYHKQAIDIVDGYRVTLKTSHKLDPEELNELEAAHADLSVVKRMLLRLGGYYHDQLALQPVIEDASGSAMAAVRDGLITNGMNRLWRSSQNYWRSFTTPEQKASIENHLLTSIMSAAQSVCESLLGPAKLSILPDAVDKEEWIYTHLNKVVEPTEYIDLVNLVHSDVAEEMRYKIQDLHADLEHLVKGNYAPVLSRWKTEGYPPIQTLGMIKELLGRSKEVALRVGLTDMIVVPGAAWTK